MTLAFSINQVLVLRVIAPNGNGLRPGSLWRSGQLLFKAEHEGRHAPRDGGPLAEARDENGRRYIIWKPAHPRAQGLVIQALDSQYCFEAYPE